MPRPLDTRLDREEGRRTAGAVEQGSAAIRRRHIWRAEAEGSAAIQLDGKFIDYPILYRAQRVLEKVAAIRARERQ
jgi:citrate lyase subunit beta/citryl-CoA lyase